MATVNIDKNSILSSNAQGSKRKKTEKMQAEVQELCAMLSVPQEQYNAENWINALCSYIKRNQRIMYMSITDYVFGLSDEQFEQFVSNLETACENAENGKIEDIDVERYELKFYDHVNLARKQMLAVNSRTEGLEDMIDNRLEPKLAQTTKELTSQLVGLVSIFTALSFIVFGSISSLESILNNLSNGSGGVLRTVIVAIAWGLCMMNVLFGFMYFVLRVTNLNREMNGTEHKNIVQRYPTVFVANFALCTALLICGWVLYMQCNGIGDGIYRYCVIDHDTLTFWLVSLLLTVIIVIAGKKLVDMYYCSNSNQAKSQSRCGSQKKTES